MKLRCNRRALVDDAGGEQNGKCLHRAVGRVDGEAIAAAFELLDDAGCKRCAEFLGLLAHPLQQISSADAPREAGVIACAGNQRCTAVSRVNDPNREVEAGEVDCCGKARRTGADDKAVKRR